MQHVSHCINDKQANLLNAHCTTEQKEEMGYIITSCKTSIEAWKLRDVNQDIARQEVLESLDENSVLLVSDWAMKYIPRKFRESQRDLFGKRGISWLLSVAIRKCSNGEMQMLTFVHIFQRQRRMLSFSGNYAVNSTSSIETSHYTLKRMDFFDPQGGKGSCDRKAALIKNHI